MLVDVIVINERLTGVVREQLFGEFLNQRLWMKSGLKVFEPHGGALVPLSKEGVHALDEGDELGVGVDGALDGALRDGKIKVTGTVGGKERLAKLGTYLPVGLEAVNIATRDSAAKVALDILNILCLLVVDVAGKVEVEVVFLNLVDADHAGVFRKFKLPGEDIDNLVEIHVAQPVLGAILHVACACVDHEDAFAGMSIFFVDDDNTSGNASAVKEVCRKSDDGLDVAHTDEFAADVALGIAPKEDAVRQNAGSPAAAFE